MQASFACPACGAPQEPPTTPISSVQCRFCGTQVIVPENLRVRPAPTPQHPEPLTISYQPLDPIQHTPLPVKRGILGCGGCGCFISLLFTAAFVGFMIFIFGFSIKSSIMYRCAVQLAQNHPQVVKLIGTPIKADTFAWISNYESSGSDETGHFSTQLSGPRGSGTLDVYGAHDRRNTDLDVTFESDGEFIPVHSGAAHCQ